MSAVMTMTEIIQAIPTGWSWTIEAADERREESWRWVAWREAAPAKRLVARSGEELVALVDEATDAAQTALELQLACGRWGCAG